jgi:hypothetical protein
MMTGNENGLDSYMMSPIDGLANTISVDGRPATPLGWEQIDRMHRQRENQLWLRAGVAISMLISVYVALATVAIVAYNDADWKTVEVNRAEKFSYACFIATLFVDANQLVYLLTGSEGDGLYGSIPYRVWTWLTPKIAVIRQLVCLVAVVICLVYANYTVLPRTLALLALYNIFVTGLMILTFLAYVIKLVHRA